AVTSRWWNAQTALVGLLAAEGSQAASGRGKASGRQHRAAEGGGASQHVRADDPELGYGVQRQQEFRFCGGTGARRERCRSLFAGSGSRPDGFSGNVDGGSTSDG